jgi:hypothetical protein
MDILNAISILLSGISLGLACGGIISIIALRRK